MAIGKVLVENKLVVLDEDGAQSFVYKRLPSQAEDDAILNSVNAISRMQASMTKEIQKVGTYLLFEM